MKKKWLAAVCVAMCAVCATVFAACSANGSSGFDANGAIAVFVRDAGSGTREAFHKTTKIDEASLSSNAVAQNGTAAILSAVANNPQSIAYESLGAVNDTVKALQYEGVAATAANVNNGTYALWRPFNVIQKTADSELSELEKDFKKFLLSKQASEIIAGEKYVALDTSTAEYTAPATAFPSGSKLLLWGSTSIQPLMDVLGAKYKQLNPNVTVTTGGSGSGEGLKVGQGTDTQGANFGMASSAIKTTDNIPEGQYFTIAKDGIAIIVSKDNTLTNITNEQLTKIYTGEATKWSDIIG